MTESFAADPAMESAIDAKFIAAFDNLTINPETAKHRDLDGVAARVDLTPEEESYLVRRHVSNEVSVALGRMMMEGIRSSVGNIARPDIIPCIQAYFDAVDAGEIEEVAA